MLLPATRPGSAAVWLAAASLLLGPAWRILPLGGALGLLCGLAGGVIALVAILRNRERALLVFAALVPFALVVLFVLAELVVGQD